MHHAHCLVPGGCISQKANVPVLTVQVLTDKLTQNPNVEEADPFVVGQVNTEVVRMRDLMYVPAKYAPQFLDS